ncbi:hypothetical protein ANN_14486 [Periplaneta americana]|uniref:Uncharacterized protein n=1 Tax=Periplaneta americana TaxID=6978 RepID=A0ABQ8SWE8_PERAM|nr:hypothetical protein ANN_14486 [Periplaneta americana]
MAGLSSEWNESDYAAEMSPGSRGESYPAFDLNGLRKNPDKNFNQRRLDTHDLPDLYVHFMKAVSSSTNKTGRPALRPDACGFSGRESAGVLDRAKRSI